MTDFEGDNLDEFSAPTEQELLKTSLELKLQQQIVFTTAKDNVGQFNHYTYFDADVFCQTLKESRLHCNFVDEYTQNLFEPFIDIANIKNEKEQENNRTWLNNRRNAVRPDIFNASVSNVALTLIRQKLDELKKDNTPFEQLEYLNYTLRLGENEECIEDVEKACLKSICTKHSKSNDMWERASRRQVSINTIVDEEQECSKILNR